MARRLHTSSLSIGDIPLDPVQAHHAREVLRLIEGDAVELFDNSGQIAAGTVILRGQRDVLVRVENVQKSAPQTSPHVFVASAVPKGERADWMVEKLSELGVAAFIPLKTERSVVNPEGKNKYERWARIATESAKQSHRRGVMRIENLIEVKQLVAQEIENAAGAVFYLSTDPEAVLLTDALARLDPSRERLLLIGPEGGWTDTEIKLFEDFGARGARLTSTILRVETAAIAGATIALLAGPQGSPPVLSPGMQ